MSDDRTPYTVIGGYLGAGKTTLLNHLLRESQGLRLAVLVNDFGDINIDAELIAAADDEVISLANGCLCCTLVDGLASTLAQLKQRSGTIDHVVVEASGVADPVKIGQYGAAFGYDLRGVVVVVDGEQIRRRAVDKYVGDTVVGALRGADLLVVNKTDLLEVDDVREVREWLAETAPTARIVEAVQAAVPAAIALGETGPVVSSGNEPSAASSEPDHAHEGHAGDHGGHAHAHSDDYDTWSYVEHTPIRRADLDAFVSALPNGVLRAKGFVYLADDPQTRHLLQLVGGRWTLTAQGAWDREQPQTRLVVIGLPGSIDGPQLGRLLTGTRGAGRSR